MIYIIWMSKFWLWYLSAHTPRRLNDSDYLWAPSLQASLNKLSAYSMLIHILRVHVGSYEKDWANILLLVVYPEWRYPHVLWSHPAPLCSEQETHVSKECFRNHLYFRNPLQIWNLCWTYLQIKTSTCATSVGDVLARVGLCKRTWLQPEQLQSNQIGILCWLTNRFQSFPTQIQ